MKLKHLTLSTLMGLAGTTAFALNTAQVTVSANVTSEATISGMPGGLDFGNVTPTTLSTTNVSYSSPQAVSIYDNNIGTGAQISTSCSKGDTAGNGCYICTDSSCTTSTQVLLTCSYTPCGTGAVPLILTPGAANAQSGYIQTIPAANASPQACQIQAGSFNCTLNKTGQMNTSGTYSGVLNLTISDGA